MATIQQQIEVAADPALVRSTWSRFIQWAHTGPGHLLCDELACVDAVRAGLVDFVPTPNGRTTVIFRMEETQDGPPREEIKAPARARPRGVQGLCRAQRPRRSEADHRGGDGVRDRVGPQGRPAAARAAEQRGGHDLLEKPLPHVSGGVKGDAQESGRPGPPALLRVASFNVRTGFGRDGRNCWPLRAAACAAAIRGLHADLVGLQEVRLLQERGLARRLPGFAGAGAGRDDGHCRGERCTVVYRPSRLRLDEWTVRWFSDTPRAPGSRSWGNPITRIVTLCRFTDRSDRRPLRLRRRALGRSLGGVSPAQRRGAARLARSFIALAGRRRPQRDGWRPGRRAAWSPPAWRHARRARRARTAGRDPPPVGRLDGRHAHRLRPRRRALDVLAARIDHARPGGRLPSDHWPVVAEVALRPAGTTEPAPGATRGADGDTLHLMDALIRPLLDTDMPAAGRLLDDTVGTGFWSFGERHRNLSFVAASSADVAGVVLARLTPADDPDAQTALGPSAAEPRRAGDRVLHVHELAVAAAARRGGLASTPPRPRRDGGAGARRTGVVRVRVAAGRSAGAGRRPFLRGGGLRRRGRTSPTSSPRPASKSSAHCPYCGDPPCRCAVRPFVKILALA